MQSRAVFGEERGQEAAIEARVVLKGVCSGVLGDDAEVDGGVPDGDAEVNQERALARFLSEGNRKIRRQGSDSAAAFGPQKDQELSGNGALGRA